MIFLDKLNLIHFSMYDESYGYGWTLQKMPLLKGNCTNLGICHEVNVTLITVATTDTAYTG